MSRAILQLYLSKTAVFFSQNLAHGSTLLDEELGLLLLIWKLEGCVGR